ncbi:MAG: hypothetical protein OEX06_01075 [Candidatus Bathyarchaeota archaeon]|nr:hypothetical protein [Candidatus Bathyarchaeota archaeon]
MHEVLSLTILLFSALEKMMSYHLLQAYDPERYEEKNPLAIIMTQKVGLSRTYLILFFLSILLVWMTCEYTRCSIFAGTLCLTGELIFFVGVFINNCAWKLFS